MSWQTPVPCKLLGECIYAIHRSAPTHVLLVPFNAQQYSLLHCQCRQCGELLLDGGVRCTCLCNRCLTAVADQRCECLIDRFEHSKRCRVRGETMHVELG